MGDPAPTHRVIGLVASAGGVDALGRVLAGLPAGFDAAVVVLLHQDPERLSELPRILARHAALPVAHARDGDPLLPGRVTVAPPGSHLLVTGDERLALVLSGDAPPSRPSADLLLTSIALACGPRAVAVVLTGAGHDGATGATAVHHLGGTVVATDEASSHTFSMPSATIDRDDAIDHVVDLDGVAALLVALAG